MISRVAECCFWLNRYIERASSTARITSVNRRTILDAELHDADRWKPILVVVGEQERFEALNGTAAYNRDATAEEYLTWEEQNPVSIWCSLRHARENARMTREVISREMWETVNSHWQWLNSEGAHKEYRQDRLQFYQRILSMCGEFQGVCHNTMLHEEPFDFMRLGMLLERASQTVRVVDVRYHWLIADSSSDVESPRESAQWVGVLRLCAAAEPFFKRYRTEPSGAEVLRFLLQDESFPQSLLHCTARALNFIKRIERHAQRGKSESRELIGALVERVRTLDIAEVMTRGLHEELTEIVSIHAQVGLKLHEEFFDPVGMNSTAQARNVVG